MPDPQSAVADLKQSVGDLFNADPSVAIVNATANVGNRAQQLMQAATKAAQDAGLDPAFVTRLIGAESNWNPFAVSKKGAQGLMQVLPSTAKQYGVSNLMNPSENIRAGISYLKDLTAKYPDRPDLVAAAYNAGPGAVDKSGGVPPYAETKAYVQKVAGQDLEKLWQPVGDTSAWKAIDETPAAKAPASSAASIAADLAIGAVKQPGRLVQMIPGVAPLTDKLYGLPPGSSAKAMEPTNTAQQLGGTAATVAETVAGGMASGIVNPNIAYTRNAIGQFVKAPYVQSYAGKAIGTLGDVASGTFAGLRNELLGTKAITATRVGELVARYGKGIVKSALAGAGLKAGWDAWEDLTK